MRIARLGDISCEKKELVKKTQETVSTKLVTSAQQFDSFLSSSQRLLEWADYIQQRLEDGINNLDNLGDKQLLLEETSAEVSSQEEKLSSLVSEGEQLVESE